MARISSALLAALALTLAACDGGTDDAVPVGTFEVEVTGDVAGSATGTAYIAEPDSGFAAGAMEWQVDLPVAFETTAGDSVRVFFSVGEPREPNGSFTEIPEGTYPFVSGSPDRTRPSPFLAVRVEGSTVGATDGTVTLRRRADGTVEGAAESRYSQPRLGGPTLRGRIALRFTAPLPTSTP